MKFVSFQLGIALTEGKEGALRLESSFDERECIDQNKAFLFDNMPQVKEKFVLDQADNSIAGSEQPRENATPSKPGIFYC